MSVFWSFNYFIQVKSIMWEMKFEQGSFYQLLLLEIIFS